MPFTLTSIHSDDLNLFTFGGITLTLPEFSTQHKEKVFETPQIKLYLLNKSEYNK